jgi:lipoprotein-releasing system permease protein
MVIAMALMSGYREDLRQKLVRGNAAVIAYPILGSELVWDDEKQEILQSVPGVTAIRPVVYGQGSLVSEQSAGGVEVTLRGIDTAAGLAGLGEVELDSDLIVDDGLSNAGVLGLVLGRDLATRLEVDSGDSVRLMVLGFFRGRPRFRYRQALVVGTFATGFSEFDQYWLVTDRQELEAMMGRELGSGMLEIVVEDPDRADWVTEQVRELLGGDYLVTSWRDLNRELFTALEVQQIALFFVLGLIVVVSTFNVASSLVVLVRERMRDIGVLAALGLSPARLRTVFLLYGAGLGAVGCLCGVLAGGAIAWIVTEFELIRFDPEMAAIYFISSVPFKVELMDVTAVVVFTLTVTLLACWIPARRAAKVRPAYALRYE